MKFNVIAAVCDNSGIGIKGNLPWKLKSELRYFAKTTKKVKDASKRNAVIMGRKTYYCIPETHRPLPGRLNIVLSRTVKQSDFPNNVLVFSSLEAAMSHLENEQMTKEIENVWIIGGGSVYQEAMSSQRCNRIYLTKIYSSFECDAFFPKIPDEFYEISKKDDEIPDGIQEEDGLKYEYKVYEKRS